jgi:hypothetical protein
MAKKGRPKGLVWDFFEFESDESYSECQLKLTKTTGKIVK